MTMIRVVDCVSAKGDGAVNEDGFGSINDSAWLFDGATGLGAQRMDAVSDAAWLVRRADRHFRDALASETKAATPVVLRDVIRRLRTEFEAVTQGADDEPAPPSAAYILLRQMNEGMELSALGDCAALCQTSTGDIAYIDGDNVPSIDEDSIHQLTETQRKFPHAQHSDILERIRPTLRKNRARMNTVGGYWILSTNEQAAGQARVISHRNTQGPIILMSDGFSRGMEMLGELSFKSFYDLILKQGAAAVLADIRAMENEDANCRRFPRFKVHDDATCAVLVVS